MTIFTQGSSPITQVRPGVQIVNVPPQVLAAQPQATNVIAIVGTASWGPTNIAVPLSNPTQCAQTFGPTINRHYDLGMPLYVAWLQGAGNFVVVRASDGTDVAATASWLLSPDTGSEFGATLTAKYTGALGNNIRVSLSTGSKVNTLKAQVSLPGIGTEYYNNLPSTTAAAFWPAFVAAINLGQGANGGSQLVIATLGTTFATAPTAGLTLSLTGGLDATDYSAVTTTTVIGSASTRTGMYALSKIPVNHLVVSDSYDTTQWTVIDAFCSSTGVYGHIAGPAGDTISNAVSAKGTAALDDDWISCSYGDWPTVFDQVNQVYRQIYPAVFKAGILAAYTPNNSALNKRLSGIVATQRSGNYQNGLTTYSDAEIGTLLNAGIDIISNPSPGGTYFSFQGGINSSSNGAVNGDNWPQMESVIGRSIANIAGIFVGQTITDRLEFNVQVSISNILANFVSQGILNQNSYAVVCDNGNNPFSATSIGILTVNVSVTYQGIVKYFNVLLEGGQTVQVVTVSNSVGQGPLGLSG
jgi:hypothetical protein